MNIRSKLALALPLLASALLGAGVMQEVANYQADRDTVTAPDHTHTRAPVLHMTCWIDDTVSFRLYNLPSMPTQADGVIIAGDETHLTYYRLAEREQCLTADRAYDDEGDMD